MFTMSSGSDTDDSISDLVSSFIKDSWKTKYENGDFGTDFNINAEQQVISIDRVLELIRSSNTRNAPTLNQEAIDNILSFVNQHNIAKPIYTNGPSANPHTQPNVRPQYVSIQFYKMCHLSFAKMHFNNKKCQLIEFFFSRYRWSTFQ